MHKLIEYFRDRPVIREWDENGLLKSAGYKWTESIDEFIAFFVLAALGLIFYGLACALDERAPSGAQFLFWGASVVCALIGYVCGTTDRGFSFERDGTIKNRAGWINKIDMMRSLKNHTHIASIEIMKTERGAAVALFTTWGGTYVLSNGLNEAHARLVCVQLTLALRELRESMTSIRSVQQRQLGTTPRTVWID